MYPTRKAHYIKRLKILSGQKRRAIPFASLKKYIYCFIQDECRSLQDFYGHAFHAKKYFQRIMLLSANVIIP